MLRQIAIMGIHLLPLLSVSVQASPVESSVGHLYRIPQPPGDPNALGAVYGISISSQEFGSDRNEELCPMVVLDSKGNIHWLEELCLKLREVPKTKRSAASVEGLVHYLQPFRAKNTVFTAEHRERGLSLLNNIQANNLTSWDAIESALKLNKISLSARENGDEGVSERKVKDGEAMGNGSSLPPFNVRISPKKSRSGEAK